MKSNAELIAKARSLHLSMEGQGYTGIEVLTDLADALKAATTPQPVHAGLWRNSLGAELRVTGFAPQTSRFRSLGDTYYAEASDSLFGTAHYIVTEKSLQEAGYVLIERDNTEAN